MSKAARFRELTRKLDAAPRPTGKSRFTRVYGHRAQPDLRPTSLRFRLFMGLGFVLQKDGSHFLVYLREQGQKDRYQQVQVQTHYHGLVLVSPEGEIQSAVDFTQVEPISAEIVRAKVTGQSDRSKAGPELLFDPTSDLCYLNGSLDAIPWDLRNTINETRGGFYQAAGSAFGPAEMADLWMGAADHLDKIHHGVVEGGTKAVFNFLKGYPAARSGPTSNLPPSLEDSIRRVDTLPNLFGGPAEIPEGLQPPDRFFWMGTTREAYETDKARREARRKKEELAARERKFESKVLVGRRDRYPPAFVDYLWRLFGRYETAYWLDEKVFIGDPRPGEMGKQSAVKMPSLGGVSSEVCLHPKVLDFLANKEIDLPAFFGQMAQGRGFTFVDMGGTQRVPLTRDIMRKFGWIMLFLRGLADDGEVLSALIYVNPGYSFTHTGLVERSGIERLEGWDRVFEVSSARHVTPYPDAAARLATLEADLEGEVTGLFEAFTQVRFPAGFGDSAGTVSYLFGTSYGGRHGRQDYLSVTMRDLGRLAPAEKHDLTRALPRGRIERSAVTDFSRWERIFKQAPGSQSDGGLDLVAPREDAVKQLLKMRRDVDFGLRELGNVLDRNCSRVPSAGFYSLYDFSGELPVLPQSKKGN